MPCIRLTLAACLLAAFGAGGAVCAEEDPSKIELAGGKLVLTAPDTWQRQRPRSRIVEHEFAIPASKGDEVDGRLTLMRAGGGVEANIERWYGQFTQPDGGSTRDRAKVKETKIAGLDVYLVDISGTYRDQRGPMAPAVERPKYRMLAAILDTDSLGTYYVKFYGPQRTVAANETAFGAMIEGLKQQ